METRGEAFGLSADEPAESAADGSLELCPPQVPLQRVQREDDVEESPAPVSTEERKMPTPPKDRRKVGGVKSLRSRRAFWAKAQSRLKRRK